MMPDAEALNDSLAEENVDAALRTLVVGVFTKLNDRLRYLYDREHPIGHAYFVGVRSLSDLRAVCADRILPLLQEYFYGQWDKVALALGYPMRADGTPKEVRGTSTERARSHGAEARRRPCSASTTASTRPSRGCIRRFVRGEQPLTRG
jgi:5-methylcytosine-specific restriction protein B